MRFAGSGGMGVNASAGLRIAVFHGDKMAEKITAVTLYYTSG